MIKGLKKMKEKRNTNKNKVNQKNDNDRLYDFNGKLYTIVISSTVARKELKAEFDKKDSKLTRKEYHKKITDIYIALVIDIEKALRWEIAGLVTVGIIGIFKEKDSELFDKLMLQKGKELVDQFKPANEQANVVKKELDNSKNNKCTHKAFAGLENYKVSQDEERFTNK